LQGPEVATPEAEVMDEIASAFSVVGVNLIETFYGLCRIVDHVGANRHEFMLNVPEIVMFRLGIFRVHVDGNTVFWAQPRS
jgi:hypothetical protein